MNLFELFVKIGVDDQASGAISKITDKLGNGLQTAARIGTEAVVAATAAITAALGAVYKVGTEYESAFAGVEKTVDATEEELKKLSDGILELSTNLPTTASDIAAVAEAAGQLGIKTEDILSFTEVMVNLGEATNLTSDEAASALAQFANVSQMDPSQYEALGSAIVDLGNNFATTEADIVSMAQRIVGAGTTIGMSEADILGLATALSSVGIEAEMGGSAISKLMLNMVSSAELGSKSLSVLDAIRENVAFVEGEWSTDTAEMLRQIEYYQDYVQNGSKILGLSIGLTQDELDSALKSANTMTKFSEVLGVTSDEMANLAANAPTEMLTMFIEALSDAGEKGSSANAVLADLGITEVRLRDTLLRSGNAAELLSTAIETSNAAWKESTALQVEAEKRYATTESQVSMLKNSLEVLGINAFAAIEPLIKEEGIPFLREQIDLLAESFSSGGLTGAVSTFGEILSNLVTEITVFAPQLVDFGVLLLDSLIKGLLENLNEIKTAAQTLLSSLIDGISSALTLLTPAAIEIIEAIIETLSSQIPQIAKEGIDIVVSLANGIMQMLPQIAKVGLDLLVSLANGIAESLPTLLPTAISVIIELARMLTDPATLSSLINAAGTILQELGNGLIEAIPQLVNAAIEIIIGLVNFLLDPEALANFLDAAVGMVSSIVDAIIENLDLLFDAAVEVIVSLVSFLIDPKNLENLASAALEIVSKLVDGIISFATKLGEAALELLLKLVEYLSDPEKLQDLFNSGVKIVGEILSGILSMLERMRSAGEELMQKVWDAISNVDWLQLGKNVVDGILGGLKSAWDALSSWVSNAWNSLFGSKEETVTITPQIDLSAIQGNAVTTAPYINPNAQIGNGLTSGVNITQNIYSSAKTPSELMTEAYYTQQRGLVN